MPNAEQLKALLQSHLDGDDDHFIAVAMQVAATKARRGHGKLAEEIRTLIDSAKVRRGGRVLPIRPLSGELGSILEVSHPKARLGEIILGDSLAQQVQRIIREQRHADRIEAHGLSPRRKLLLVGPPGTGKTLTASVLAGELCLPLMQVRLDGLITKYMGETAAKLRQVFDSTTRAWGIYFFDEFDAIGSQRGFDNDVGEIRRVLNSFLQMIEQDRSQSLVIAATNHPSILDSALFRRFDDILRYELPDAVQIVKLLRNRLAGSTGGEVRWSELAKLANGLSFAEVARAADEALKDALVHGRGQICEWDIREMLAERKAINRDLSTTWDK